jgi:enoyl-CoA hydratase
MTDTNVLLEERHDAVALLTVNRPEKMNALNAAVRAAIFETFDRLRADPGVRVVVLTGAGDKAFIAGADIGEFENRRALEQYRAMQAGDIYAHVDRFPKPVIAMINGYCLGGGCELALACDIRIASDRAKLGQPEINLGIIPGGGGTQRLPRLVGEGVALRMIYTGEIVDAARALAWGLVDEVVPHDRLRDRTLELARAIAQKSPAALQAAKEAVKAAARMPLDEGLKYEKVLFGLLFSTEDKEEGVRAFLEKRTPTFHGR